MLIWFNAHDETVTFKVPTGEHCQAWEIVVDTTGTLPTDDPLCADTTIDVPGRALVALRAHVPDPDGPDTSAAASVARSA